MKDFAYHNSFSETFRTPFGAQSVCSDFSLAIFTAYECKVSVIFHFGDKRTEVSAVASTFTYNGRKGYMHTVLHKTPDAPGLLWYMFRMEAEGKVLYYCGNGGEGYLSEVPERSYQITVYVPYPLPEWVNSAVAYQIFPDRFARGDVYGGLLRVHTHTNTGQRVYIHSNWNEDVNSLPERWEKYYTPCDFFCGDLKGIEENLPYLTEMGVNCIYLNPIFCSPSNHRYDTSDYMHADGILGGDEAFFSLKAACKEAGVHLILDGVFSHTGSDSIYFNRENHFNSKGAYQSINSPYYSWYDFSRYPDEYRSWWGHPTLPETNEDDKSYQDFIAKVAQKWSSSWRLDVADELTDGFLAFFYKKVKEIDCDSVVIGEVWEDASDKHSKGHRRPYTDGGYLDGVMNYPLRDWCIRFICGSMSAEEFARNINLQTEKYPPNFLNCCLNMTGTHDTKRLFSVLNTVNNCRTVDKKYTFGNIALTNDEKSVILMLSVLFFAKGIPCIYYGDEQGMEGGSDPFCRRPFVNTGSHLRNVCILLAALRRRYTKSSDSISADCIGDDVLIIKRDKLCCIINRSPDTGYTVHLPFDRATFTDITAGKTCNAAFSENALYIAEKTAVAVVFGIGG